MSWRHVIDAADLLDDAGVGGEDVARWWRAAGLEDIEVTTVTTEKGSTDVVRASLPGSNGRTSGGQAPTLSIIGQLGGIGARPEQLGFVSDGDGALTAVAAAAKLGQLAARGDRMPGDVVVTTHICPNAPTRPHDPVPFMDSPIGIAEMNARQLSVDADAILSVDTSRGNRLCNHVGFAISPTVRQGWILRVSEDLLAVQERVTGTPPVVLPLATQDITPYGNGVHHINSILQPATGTELPVVGVALTSVAPVAGSATGATDLSAVEAATRFCVEVAKDFGRGRCAFYDGEEFDRLVELYGPMTRLQG